MADDKQQQEYSVGKPKKIQTFTRDKLGGINVDEFEIESNRINASLQFSDFIDRLLTPTPNLMGFVSRPVTAMGSGAVLACLALTGTVGSLVTLSGVGLLALAVTLINNDNPLYIPRLGLFVLPFAVGFGMGLWPSIHKHFIEPNIGSTEEVRFYE